MREESARRGAPGFLFRLRGVSPRALSSPNTNRECKYEKVQKLASNVPIWYNQIYPVMNFYVYLLVTIDLRIL